MKLFRVYSVQTIIGLFILGFLLLLKPLESLSVGSYIVGILLCLWGISNIIVFFKKISRTFVDIMNLIVGLLVTGVGIYCLIQPTWIIATINVVVGILLIVFGILNIRDLFRIKERKAIWIILLIVAILLIISGIVVVLNPVNIAKFITRLEGISLIIEATSNILLGAQLEKNMQVTKKIVMDIK